MDIEGLRFYFEDDQDEEQEGEEFSLVKRIPREPGLTDTGSSCVYVPNYAYDLMIEQISLTATSQAYLDLGMGYEELVVNCNDMSSLPRIDILFGGYWL